LTGDIKEWQSEQGQDIGFSGDGHELLVSALGPSTHNRECAIDIAASCPATPSIVDSIRPYSILALTPTMSFFRIAARAVRAPAQPRIQVASRIQRLNQARTFSVASVKRADEHDPHHEESFEEFTAR
jgi:hypothetical protein